MSMTIIERAERLHASADRMDPLYLRFVARGRVEAAAFILKRMTTLREKAYELEAR
jgi:hypothetical protein